MLPKPSGQFEWTQEEWGPALRCGPLLSIAEHFFTTRRLPLGGATADAIAAWRKLAAAMAVGPDHLVLLRQVHGARVVEASLDIHAGAQYDEWPEGDITITNDPRVALAVRVADCVPLLLSDRRTGAVAAVHAGWRGVAAGAPLAAVAALGQTYGTRPANLVAAVGPSIGPCCFAVGAELLEVFSAQAGSSEWFSTNGGLRLDLWRATLDQLRRAGVPEADIHLSRLCTACHLDVFCSYRKERDRTGRMAGVIRPRGAITDGAGDLRSLNGGSQAS